MNRWKKILKMDEKTKYSLLNRLIVDSVLTDGFQSSDLF